VVKRFFKREEVVGKLVITQEAKVLGKVADVAISLNGKIGLSIRDSSGKETIITLDKVSAIGDVILLKHLEKTAGEAEIVEQVLPKGKICPKCGKLNRENVRFCTYCGTKLT